MEQGKLVSTFILIFQFR